MILWPIPYDTIEWPSTFWGWMGWLWIGIIVLAGIQSVWDDYQRASTKDQKSARTAFYWITGIITFFILKNGFIW